MEYAQWETPIDSYSRNSIGRKKIRHKAFNNNLKNTSHEFNRVCNTPAQVNVPWLSASHFLSWSTCGVLERGRNNTPHQPFSDVHGGGNPFWPSLTPYDLFKWQYKTSWHLFISTVCACDSFTQNSLPKPSFLIYFHHPWNVLFKPSSPLYIHPPRDQILALQYLPIWALVQIHSSHESEVCSSPAFQKHR